jgi:hypothetical protein
MQSTRYSSQILMKTEFYGQIFEKILNITFHENPLIGSRVVPCERTEIDAQACRKKRLCERAAKGGWEG